MLYIACWFLVKYIATATSTTAWLLVVCSKRLDSLLLQRTAVDWLCLFGVNSHRCRGVGEQSFYEFTTPKEGNFVNVAMSKCYHKQCQGRCNNQTSNK